MRIMHAAYGRRHRQRRRRPGIRRGPRRHRHRLDHRHRRRSGRRPLRGIPHGAVRHRFARATSSSPPPTVFPSSPPPSSASPRRPRTRPGGAADASTLEVHLAGLRIIPDPYMPARQRLGDEPARRPPGVKMGPGP
jgi:hypothetical protein